MCDGNIKQFKKTPETFSGCLEGLTVCICLHTDGTIWGAISSVFLYETQMNAHHSQTLATDKSFLRLLLKGFIVLHCSWIHFTWLSIVVIDGFILWTYMSGYVLAQACLGSRVAWAILSDHCCVETLHTGSALPKPSSHKEHMPASKLTSICSQHISPGFLQGLGSVRVLHPKPICDSLSFGNTKG